MAESISICYKINYNLYVHRHIEIVAQMFALFQKKE